MKLSIPHNWQSDLIHSIDLSCVTEFYGKLDSDILGGGRSSNISPRVCRNAVQKEIREIHRKNLNFNYLLNSTCLDNKEFSWSFRRQLHQLIDWLKALEVDSVTVSMPYILNFIRKRYPDFRIYVSTMAQVDSPDKARYWQDLGVDKITLYEVNVNRNLKLIEKIRRSVKCQLQLIANNGCLYDCPFTVNHGLLCSHASQSGHILQGFIIDFYRIMCSYMRLKDPVNFVRSDWIRPEDISCYENLGIDCIKIVNRGMTSEAIKNIVKAYSDRKYEGNLLDLFPSPAKNISFKKRNFAYLLRYFFHPIKTNIFKLPKIKKVFEESSVCYIDNSKLTGFLAALQEKKCDSTLCSDCNWCKKIAETVVTIDIPRRSRALKENESLIEELVSGKIFKYI